LRAVCGSAHGDAGNILHARRPASVRGRQAPPDGWAESMATNGVGLRPAPARTPVEGERDPLPALLLRTRTHLLPVRSAGCRSSEADPPCLCRRVCGGDAGFRRTCATALRLPRGLRDSHIRIGGAPSDAAAHTPHVYRADPSAESGTASLLLRRHRSLHRAAVAAADARRWPFPHCPAVQRLAFPPSRSCIRPWHLLVLRRARNYQRPGEPGAGLRAPQLLRGPGHPPC